MMVTRPTLIIDKAKCVRNIQLMANKALRNSILFRPHFKTHQSAATAKWYRDAGVTKATVSSVSMARYFADHGWEDITIAFPVNILEIDEINQLAERIELNVLVESRESAHNLSHHLTSTVGIFIEIDCGYGRTGIDPYDHNSIDSVLNIFEDNPNMDFKGFLTHAGHSYHARSNEEIHNIYEDSTNLMVKVKSNYIDRYPDIILSYGDTPTASVIKDLSAIDELRPGNFIYYDLMQWNITSCEIKDIAVAIECPIVSIHAERGELIIYGGGVHFSKDRLEIEPGKIIFGIPVAHEDKGWGALMPHSFLTKISQEHGTIQMPHSRLQSFKIGDTIKILPVHSCMAADLLKNKYVII